MILVETTNTPDAWGVRALADEPWDACGWTRQGQRQRHEAVVRALQPQTDDRILDFGCGTGELADHLPWHPGYVGYDWSPGMVQRARRDHPGRRFVDRWPLGLFDLVAAVGPFNLPDNWSKQHTWHTLRHLWDTTGCRTLVVSLYHGTDPACLSYGIAETARAAAQLTASAVLRQWRHNDLLLIAHR